MNFESILMTMSREIEAGEAALAEHDVRRALLHVRVARVLLKAAERSELDEEVEL